MDYFNNVLPFWGLKEVVVKAVDGGTGSPQISFKISGFETTRVSSLINEFSLIK